jgi:hypothetical protein
MSMFAGIEQRSHPSTRLLLTAKAKDRTMHTKQQPDSPHRRSRKQGPVVRVNFARHREVYHIHTFVAEHGTQLRISLV